MTKTSSFFRRNIICTMLICLTLLKSCSTRNYYSNLDLSSQTLNPTVTGFTMTRNTANGYLGNSVSTAGDIDNDGYDDIIIGATGTGADVVYVIYGGQQSSFLNVDLSTTTLDPLTTGFTITGNAANDQFGNPVSIAGDIDNDGYDDIIIGAYPKDSFRGAAYVIYGGPKSTRANINLSSTQLNPDSTGFTITGSTAGDFLGYSASTAGDINNDGYDDIIVGAPYKNSWKGAAYVIYGGPKSSMSNWDFSSGATLNPSTTGFMITGTGDFQFGESVSTAGDINNDGYDDIIIGTPSNTMAYVIYGNDKSTMSNIDMTSTTLNPSSTGFTITGGSRFGERVSTAGDVNKDGYDDIVIGAPRIKNNQGAVYVIYGGTKSSMSNLDFRSGATLNPASTGFIITGNSANNWFGHSVTTAGDINNDGYDDIIIGAYYKNNRQGAAYVIYGGAKPTMSNIDLSSTTLDPTLTGFMITGNAAGDSFGYSVSSAGDINNDGYDDIIIGASTKNTNQGAAYVIYGSCSANCNQCSSGPVCTECQSSYLMYQSECFASCPDATFAHTATSCEDCPAHCDQCTSESVCTECANSYLMYQSECFASCPEATVATSPNLCEDCPAHCKHCSSKSVCTECEGSYFIYNSKCFSSCPEATIATSSNTCADCPAHCNDCSSTSVCTECQNSYIFYQDKCLDTCPDGMFLLTTTCEDCPTNCNHCTSPSLCTECINPFVLYESQCLTSCPKAMFNDNNECKDCPAYCTSCTSQDSCQVCFEGFTLSNSLCVAPVSVPSSSYQEVQAEAIQRILSAARILSSVVCVGRTVTPFATLVSKTVQNTRYLNLSVTSDLSEVYQTWEKDMISWQVPNSFSNNEDNFDTSPLLFTRYDTSSPFLVNFWPTFINIAGGLAIFITCFVLQRLLEKSKYERWASLVQGLVAGSFNFTLIQAYVCLDDALFYLVLDIRTNPLDSFFSCASLICALIFLTFGCLLVLFNLWMVKKYQKTKKQELKGIKAFNQKNKYWKLFYSEFNDNDLWSQSFFAILITRSTFSSLIITALYDYPLVQTLILLAIDIFIISFLYVKTPFKTLRGKLAQYFYEITTLLVHLCTFSLSLKPSHTGKSVFSTVIIYLNTALIMGAVGFMIFEIYKTISAIRAARLKRRQVVPVENQEIQNLTQTKSPLHSPEIDSRKRPEWANQNQPASPGVFDLLPEATTPNGDADQGSVLKLLPRAQNRRQIKQIPNLQ